jgi:hypothetical protein
MTTTVTGRNGFQYDAKHISGNLYIVGKFIVIVLDGICQETVCKATKANVAAMMRRAEVVGYCH